MRAKNILSILFIAISLNSCSSDEPQWADPEAHEKTVKLNEQYGPLMVGTWHLTFNADGTLSGLRKWQLRQVVTIDGQEE